MNIITTVSTSTDITSMTSINIIDICRPRRLAASALAAPSPPRRSEGSG